MLATDFDQVIADWGNTAVFAGTTGPVACLIESYDASDDALMEAACDQQVGYISVKTSLLTRLPVATDIVTVTTPQGSKDVRVIDVLSLPNDPVTRVRFESTTS